MKKYEVKNPTPTQRVRLEKGLRWLSVSAFVSGVILSAICLVWCIRLAEEVRQVPVAGIGFMLVWIFVQIGIALAIIFLTTIKGHRKLLGITVLNVYYWLGTIGIILCFSTILMFILSLIYAYA